jgi:hypothetical protein
MEENLKSWGWDEVEEVGIDLFSLGSLSDIQVTTTKYGQSLCFSLLFAYWHNINGKKRKTLDICFVFLSQEPRHADCNHAALSQHQRA